MKSAVDNLLNSTISPSIQCTPDPKDHRVELVESAVNILNQFISSTCRFSPRTSTPRARKSKYFLAEYKPEQSLYGTLPDTSDFWHYSDEVFSKT